MRATLVLLALVSLTACGRKPDAAPEATAAVSGALPTPELMEHMIQPAAEMYWSGWGADVDAAGIHEHAPTTPEGWAVLINGATILSEAGASLQREGRSRSPEAEWNRYAQAMTKVALEGREAAERQDKQAIFDKGNELYFACLSCHQKFAPQIEGASPTPQKHPPPKT
jgi:hypothetical protein